MFLEPLELPARRLVFMAVNDNTAADVAGGSHWWELFDIERRDQDRQVYRIWRYSKAYIPHGVIWSRWGR